MPRRKKELKIYSAPPETEVQLMKLQTLYLENKNDRKVADDYFMLLRTYARSLVLKEIKRKGIFLIPERVDEASTDATLAVLEQYKTEGWSIGASFAGVLKYKIWQALYTSKNDEKTYSLNAKFSDDEGSKEVMDTVAYDSTMPWNHSESALEFGVEDTNSAFIESVNVSYGEVNEIIDFAYDSLPYKTFMRFLPWIVLQFRNPKTRNVQSLFDKIFLTNGEQNAFDILLLEIRNRINEYT